MIDTKDISLKRVEHEQAQKWKSEVQKLLDEKFNNEFTIIPNESLKLALKLYEDKLCSSYFYGGMPDGKLHHKEASVLRGCLLQLGILDEEANSKIVRRAQLRADKSRKGVKQ
jgi:hypothetical protein